MQERRHAERFQINLRARWESLLASGRGTVCDLSESGCCVLGGRAVQPGELIRLAIEFPDHVVLAWGEVVYALPEVGFALRFLFNQENEKRALHKLVERLSDTV